MATLWTFGDSFTAGNGCRIDSLLADGGLKYYNEYKKEDDDIWPNILGKKINYKTINLGKSGASNDQIIDLIIDNASKFELDDIIIIGKTFYQRFDLPDKKTNEFVSYLGESLNVMNKRLEKDDINETIIKYGIFFSDNELFKIRQDKRFNFIKESIANRVKSVLIWDVMDSFRSSIETIREHTNNEIKDLHFSFNGQKQMANIIYDKIFKVKYVF